MSKYRNVFLFGVIFLCALLVRIILVNWTLQFWNNGDLVRYEDWARVAHVYSLADTYHQTHVTTIANNEPPGTLYILSATYETYIMTGKLIAKLTHTAVGSNPWINIILETIFMKSSSIITDLLMGILAYILVAKEKGAKRGLLAAALIWFNPVILYNSAIWGQTDSLNNFFFLLTLFLAFYRKYFLSICTFIFSIFIKFSLLPLLPFYAVFLYFYSGKKLKPLIIDVVIAAIVSLTALLPLSQNPIQWLIHEAPIIAGGEYQNIAIVAYNFWWAITCLPTLCNNTLPLISQTFLFIPLGIWAYVIFTAATLPFFYLQIKKHKNLLVMENVFLLFSLVALCVFLFLPRMHDRYLYPIFPLFAIAIGLSKSLKIYLSIFVGFILLHLSNLLGSWYPTYFPAFIFYQILYSTIFRWCVSILTLIFASWMYIKSLRGFNKKLTK